MLPVIFVGLEAFLVSFGYINLYYQKRFVRYAIWLFGLFLFLAFVLVFMFQFLILFSCFNSDFFSLYWVGVPLYSSYFLYIINLIQQKIEISFNKCNYGQNCNYVIYGCYSCLPRILFDKNVDKGLFYITHISFFRGTLLILN